MKALTVISVALLLVAPATLAVADEGMELYGKKCAMCHGKDGVAKSMAKGSANLNDAAWKESATVESVVKVMTEGKGKMKGYQGKLTDEQIKAIAEYVMKL